MSRDARIPRRRFLAATLAAAPSARAAGRALAHDAPASSADAPRRIARRGFFDLQVNGFAGVDFNDPAVTSTEVQQALDALLKTGVTRCFPTLITAPLERFARCARTIVDVGSPAIAGLHVEGPYISPQEGARGAHPKEFITPASIDDFERRREAARDRIRLLTVAPEVPGVLPLVEHARKAGISVAIGHTAASPEQIRDAIRAGATLSTHLGNGCAQMLPRHPNFIWEQLAADELTAGLIVDGHHLPPATVKAMVRAKAGRAVLVTDATAAAGQPQPGDYRLGTLLVHVDENGRVAVPGQPNLAGSALALDRAVGNVVRFAGIPLDEALEMASERPAEAVGLEAAGRLEAEWDGQRLRVINATV